jgi:hypothetical protein
MGDGLTTRISGTSATVQSTSPSRTLFAFPRLMDILPYPKDPAIDSLEVPYICEDIEQYDGLDYFKFGVRSKWTSDFRYWDGCDTETAAARAQSWLFFGLLQICLGDSFDIAHFTRICSCSGKQIITLVKLESSLSEAGWEHLRLRILATAHPRPLLMGEKWRFGNSWLVKLCLRVRDIASPLRDMSFLANTIFISIDVLVWSLLAISGYKIHLAYALPQGSINDVLKKRMVENGWCKFWVEKYASTCSAGFLHYASGMKVIPQRDLHHGCSTTACGVGRRKNEDDYPTKHVTKECQCSFAGPDMEVVGSILEGRGTPLLELVEMADGSIEVNTVKAMFERPYIAISHVWADGLGNPSSNSLPQCQLRELAKALQIFQRKEVEAWLDGSPDGFIERYLHGTIPRHRYTRYLWIDTLCVPRNGRLRSLALNRMALTYAAATHVLVLDRTVQGLRLDGHSSVEIAFRLSTCPWMSRCWTFQEACLAKSYHFLLSDALLDPIVWIDEDGNSDGYSSGAELELRRQTKRRVEQMLRVDALHRLVDSTPDVAKHTPSLEPHLSLQHLTKIWNELALRNTVYEEDKHIMLATMLGLSAEEILSMPPECRMQAILGSQQLLPLSMLLFPGRDDICHDANHRWFSNFPTGPISSAYGVMAWARDNSSLEFCPRETDSCVFLIKSSAAQSSLQLHASIFDSSEIAAADRPSIFWIRDDSPASPIDPPATGYYCYFLFGCLNGIHTSEYRGPGARFAVNEISADGSLCLSFDRCVGFFYARTGMIFGPDEAEAAYGPPVHSDGIFSDVTCQLSCGELSDPQ